MTGFAQARGASGSTPWTWEIKTVNAKGLDVRLRVPQGFDALDIASRRRIAARLTRGTCHATLAVTRDTPQVEARINTALLASLIRGLADLPVAPTLGPATLDGLLGVRGVVEQGEPAALAEDTEALETACGAGLDEALDALVAARAAEGLVLAGVMTERLAVVERLTRRADEAPQRQPAAIRAKIAQTIDALAGHPALDPNRLHQEALLLAAKADVREELDRLYAHVGAAADLIASGGPIGRRLDFLAQEMGREASTFCAKVNDAALTVIGLELRVEIEQFREQAQNIE